MVKKIFRMIWILSYVMTGCGFYDFEKARSEKLIGDIYVVNLNLPEDSGFYLVFRRKPGREEYLFKDFEYVQEVMGNDSLLLVKTQVDSIYNYRLIRHQKGTSIVSTTDLTIEDFIDAEKKIKSDYSFGPKKN